MRKGSLSLEWEFTNIPSRQVVQNAILYFNETNFEKPDSQNTICTWIFDDQKPRITRGKDLFPGRIFATYEPYVYKLTLANLQYNDTGSFYLRVAIGNDAITPFEFDNAVIRISKINGEYRFLSLLCRYLVMKFLGNQK